MKRKQRTSKPTLQQQLDEALTFIAWVSCSITDDYYDKPIERVGMALDCAAYAGREMRTRWLEADWQAQRVQNAEQEILRLQAEIARLEADMQRGGE